MPIVRVWRGIDGLYLRSLCLGSAFGLLLCRIRLQHQPVAVALPTLLKVHSGTVTVYLLP